MRETAKSPESELGRSGNGLREEYHSPRSDVAILLWRTLLWVARPLALIEETVKVVDYRSINVDLLHSYIASVFQLEVRSSIALSLSSLLNFLRAFGDGPVARYQVVKVSNHGWHVSSSSPVPQKTRRIGQRCTLNLSRAEMSSRWCGVVVRRGCSSSGVALVI
ncbi:hypothetical protein TNCV_2955391 [Trichonephila clavipes]|nr:hypothetical protein TNCV_2955391 [Trichonephila clavipes]